MYRHLIAFFTFTICLILAGCGGAATSTAPAGPVVLKGAGATAPYLAYSKWLEAYKKEDPATNIEYVATGSGDGLRQLEAGTVDFAASDIPLTDAEIATLKIKPLHFPTLIGAIVPVYNLPDIADLKFTGEALAGIFSGKIKSWNDPALAKTNPGVALPATRILVIHRSDASGSTHVLTDFLTQVNPAWKKDIGVGATVKWPVGQAVTRNEGLAEAVKKMPHSIGYVELNYAIEQKLPYGSVRNAAGKFQKPDLQALGAAVDAAQSQTSDFRVNIVNSKAEGAYPIATLTWLIVPSQIPDGAKQKAMKRFLRWAYAQGQKIAMQMDYDVLQPPLLDRVRDQIGDIH
jgi:phosphate transport system substrate-binding protein